MLEIVVGRCGGQAGIDDIRELEKQLPGDRVSNEDSMARSETCSGILWLIDMQHTTWTHSVTSLLNQKSTTQNIPSGCQFLNPLSSQRPLFSNAPQ